MHKKTRKYLEIKLVAYFLTFQNINGKEANKIIKSPRGASRNKQTRVAS